MQILRSVFGIAGALVAASVIALPAQSLLTVDRYPDIERVSSPQISPDGNHVVFTRAHVDLVHDAWAGLLWEMEADGSRQRQLVKGWSAQWSPDGTRIAYLADAGGAPQLWVRYMDGEGATVQVTRGERSPEAFRWAPDSRSVAFTMPVADTAIWSIRMPAAPDGAHWTPAPRIVTRLAFRADGDGYLGDDWIQVFVVGAEGGAPRRVTHGNFNVGARSAGIPAPAALDWLPDGKTLVLDGNDAADADRQYHLSSIFAVDVTSGVMHRLTADSGFWHTPIVSPDGKWIAFAGAAAHSGSYHTDDLYVIHPDGGGLRKLTTGFDRNPDAVRWIDNETLLFSAEDRGSINTWTAQVTARTPAVKAASNGVHVVALSSVSVRSGTAVATRTAPQQPAEIVRFSTKKPWDLQPLTHVNDAVMAGLRLGDVDEIEYASSGDAKVQGWIVKPPGFDPAKKYPLILEVHGGPRAMYNIGFNASFQNFAAAGYLVLFVNPRGSTGYGSAFGNAIDKAYPGVDFDDLMAGVNEAISHGSVDTTRMYIGGCSGGGILSSWAIGHTDRFAAAAVRCPVTDWISMIGVTDVPLYTGDLFAKPFWEDPVPWLKLSPIMYAGHISTPTLIMTGDLDMRTPMPQSEELYTALKLRGVPTTLLRFAAEYHGTASKPSNWMRTQLYMLSWYGRYSR